MRYIVLFRILPVFFVISHRIFRTYQILFRIIMFLVGISYLIEDLTKKQKDSDNLFRICPIVCDI